MCSIDEVLLGFPGGLAAAAALDVADEQPEGRIYVIPARLEQCEVPARLAKFHWVDLFEEGGYSKVLEALKVRAAEIQSLSEG